MLFGRKLLVLKGIGQLLKNGQEKTLKRKGEQMLVKDLTIEKLRIKELKKKHKKKKAEHKSSGKLNASNLGKPLQHQVLKLMGVEPTPLDDYTLGVFERGFLATKFRYFRQFF